MRAHYRVDRSEMEHHHSWISQSVIYIGIELPGQLKRTNKRKNLMIKEWVLSPI